MDSPQALFNALAGLAVVLGLVYCFAGYRIRRFILAVPGYIAGAAIFGAIAYLLSQEMWVAVLVGVFAGGPIGASIVLALYNIKIFSIGLLLGAVIDVALYLITDGQIEPAVLLIIPIVTGILALIYDKWVIVAGTAFGGAGLAVGGIAYFAFGGVGPAALFALMEADPSLLAATLGGWLVLGVAGVIVQYQSLKPRDGGDGWGGPGGGSDQDPSPSPRPASSAEGRSSSRATPGPQPRIRRQALTGHRGEVKSIIWDPYGRWFATAGEYGDVYLWDTASGRPLHQLWGSNNEFRDDDSLSVSLDGSWLAANSWRGERWIWDTGTGRLLAGPDSELGDGRYARAIDPSGNVLDRTAWARLRKRGDRGWTDRATDPNGRWLASGDEWGRIRIYEMNTWRRLAQLTAKRDIGFAALVASGDGRWLASNEGNSLDFWFLGGTISDQDRPFHGTPGVAYRRVERVGLHYFAVAGRNDHHSILQLWELSDVPELLWQKDFRHGYPADPLTVSPRGDWIASTSDGIDIWDSASGKHLHHFPEHTEFSYSTALTASADGGALAAADANGNVALFGLATGTNHHRMPCHRRSLNALEMAADRSWLAAAGADGTVRLWDPETGRLIDCLTGHRGENHGGVVAMAASNDGSRLATADRYGSAITWDMLTRIQAQTINLSGFDDGARLAWTHDGKHLALADKDGRVGVFDSRSADVQCSSDRYTPASFPNRIRCRLQHSIGRPLASGFLYEDLCVWGSCHERMIAHAAKHGESGTSTGSLGRPFRAALQIVREIGWLPKRRPILGIAPSSDSPWLATPGESCGIFVRSSRTGEVLHELQGHQGRVNSLAVHPNGRWLFSAGDDGIIRRWDMSRLPAKPVCDLAMEALPDDDWVVWTDPEDADGPDRFWTDYSPGAKRWLGWHAPVAGTDRWAHQPMDAFSEPR